ncbi:salicylate hydroxylase [Pestalotiopsis sp. NC0098]|nr:salicylate hydroxylase [Pestalotiopsis sp. NC0098]
MTSGDRLFVTVVGGGIAGLCAAIALRRAGHTVHVYERSGLNNEVGAAIHLPPNATRALLAWGLDPVRAKLVTVKSSFRAKADTLERFHVGTSEAAIAETYGGPWFFAHRVDFHDELKLLATNSAGEGIPVVIHVKSEVSQYDPDVPSITLSNGSVITSDVVIGADGIHSTAVEAVLGRVNKPVPSRDLYNFCYRFLIPTSEIESDPETRFWTEDDDGRMKFFVGDLKRIASYPCRNNEMHNFVALFHQDDFSMMKKEDWQAPVSKSQLLETFTGLHPKLEAVLDKATEIKQWALLYREPIPTWIRGKLALAGDACHPMLPHQGQGGAQGIEDSVALGLVFCGARKEDVPVRLALYEKIRRNRASLIQIFSNAGQDEAELIRQEASKYMPPEEIPKSPEEFFDFNFGYDVIQDTLNHRQSLDPSFEVPKAFFEREPTKGVYPKSAQDAGSTMSYQDVSKTARAMPQIQMVEVTDREL